MFPGLDEHDHVEHKAEDGKLFTVRIFPDDETTRMEYKHVTHVFWEANNTVLTICLPEEGKHEHWLRERIRHYTITDEI